MEQRAYLPALLCMLVCASLPLSKAEEPVVPAPPSLPPTNETCVNCDYCCVEEMCGSYDACVENDVPILWVKGVPNWVTVIVGITVFILIAALLSLLIKHCCKKKEEEESLVEKLVIEPVKTSKYDGPFKA